MSYLILLLFLCYIIQKYYNWKIFYCLFRLNCRFSLLYTRLMPRHIMSIEYFCGFYSLWSNNIVVNVRYVLLSGIRGNRGIETVMSPSARLRFSCYPALWYAENTWFSITNLPRPLPYSRPTPPPHTHWNNPSHISSSRTQHGPG